MTEPQRKKRRPLEHNNSTYLLDQNNPSASEETGRSCGIIKNVTLKNFMCHEHLSVDFKEKINLVQGRNGSGKSAILSGVMVALGGSTRTTNRGSSLKDLIKYDKHTASVNLTLMNVGKDAYKPDVYGSHIIVERKIMVSGASSYCLKSGNGKVVSNKREEMKRMCDFYNLDVENPLMILNQDMSRSFLHSLDPHNLYKFFYQATQLQQMTDCYNQLEESIKATSYMITDRDASLYVIEKELQEVENLHQICLKNEGKRMKLKELRRELVWAKISEIEEEKLQCEKQFNDISALTDKLADKQHILEKKVKETEDKYSLYMAKFGDMSKKLKEQNTILMRKNEAQSKAKKRVKELQSEVYKDGRYLENMDQEIEILNSTIKRDFTEAQQTWEKHNRQHQEDKQKIEIEVENQEQIMKTDQTHLMNIQNTIKVKLDAMQQIQFEENMKSRNIKDLEHELRSFKSQQSNSFTVFGHWVQPLLEKIEVAFKQNRFSAKPVGPVGAYIEMRDNRWTHIAEMVIGSRISAFCVNSQADAGVLRTLFQGINFGNFEPTIICCKFRPRHSINIISKYEVQSETYPSLWSIMNIKSDVVANLILDRNQVEMILPIPTAEEAGKLLKNKNTVPRNTKVAYTLNGDKYFPDPNFRVYSGPGKRSARYLQVSVGQRAQELSRSIKEVNEELMKIKQSCKYLQSEISELKVQEKVSNDKILGQKISIQKLRSKLRELTNQIGPPRPPNVAQIEEEKKELEARKVTVEERLCAIKENLKTAQEEFREADGALSEGKEQFEELKETAQNLDRDLTEAQEESQKYSEHLKILKKKYKNHEVKKEELKAILLKKSTLLETELKLAEKFSPRKETKRSPLVVDREYRTLEERLNFEQTNLGDPVKIAEKLKEKTEKYKILKAELEGCKSLIMKLQNSLKIRLDIGSNFRKVVSIIVKTAFAENLSSRQLKGKLKFDFDNKTLEIQLTKMDIETDENSNSKSKKNNLKRSQQEKLSMMSGGERSYATVSLILALWHVMDSPVRILDEFDVFMDIVARRQSLDTMITHAKANTQYIYLTPLEINQGHIEKGVNIVRMADPERTSIQE